MNADIYHNQLRPYMQGIKVTSVSKTNIALTKISVPSLPEQQKIADCLSSFDWWSHREAESNIGCVGRTEKRSVTADVCVRTTA